MRRLDAAPLSAAVGALVLLVSLFLNWYQPGLSAWTVFEVLDLVLAALALAVLGIVLAHLLQDAPLREGLLPVLGGAAFVVVLSQIINHPPAAQGASVEGGAWLALAGSAIMAVAGTMTAAGITLVVSSRPPRDRRPEPPARRAAARPQPPPPRGPSPATEAAAVEPSVQDELYPEAERRGPIGADDPEPWTAGPEDETLPFDPERREEGA